MKKMGYIEEVASVYDEAVFKVVRLPEKPKEVTELYTL